MAIAPRVGVSRSLLTVSLMSTFAVASAVSAAELHVEADGSGKYPTIEAAIEASVDGDEVVLGDGVFRGDGNRDLELPRHDLTIRSASGDPIRTRLDVEGSAAEEHFGFYRGFFAGADRYVLEGISITGGHVRGFGSAVHLDQGELVMRRCWVFGNTVNDFLNGVIESWDDETTCRIEECVVVGNDGHGIAHYGFEIAVSRSTLADNRGAGLLVSMQGFPTSRGRGRGATAGFGGGSITDSILWGSCFDDVVSLGVRLEADRCLLPEDSIYLEYGGRVEFLTEPLHDDPLFCDHRSCDVVPHAVPGDYGLALASPAMPDHNPWGVQLGPLGPGCAVSPVAVTSWSELKDRHR